MLCAERGLGSGVVVPGRTAVGRAADTKTSLFPCRAECAAELITPETKHMAVEITFIRHGETEGNRAGLWQGHTDTPLTERGREQAALLGARLRGRPYDLVVSSDLGRAMATAEQVNGGFEKEPGFREADIGGWEGLSTTEIEDRFPGQLQAMREVGDVKLGGGESYPEFAGRVEETLAKTLARLDDGERALVIAHGGVIGTIVRNTLGGRGGKRRPVSRIVNTALNVVRFDDGDRRQLVAFNDASHLNGDARASGNGSVWLVRHGETEANVEHRWQGITDGSLSGEGRRQADRLAEWGLPLDVVYSSPLRRARATAAVLAASVGAEQGERADLAEMAFGEWEDLTMTEIAARWPDEFGRIYEDDVDLPRGGTGETWAGAGRRLGTAVADLAATHPGKAVGVVTHAGATRSYVCSLLGLDFTARHRVASPVNTSFTRVEMMEGRPILGAYNLAPHLEH